MTVEKSQNKINSFLKIVLQPIRYLLMKLVWEPRYWKKREADIVNCPDTAFIPKLPDAGQVKNGYLIMHNGLLIEPLSYYGKRMLKIFKKTKGVHEPQEERFFMEVLNSLRPGATMVELGSYWSFYSMWFNAKIKDAKNFMVEPTSLGLNMGEKNFRINNMTGDFTQAYIGLHSGIAPDQVRVVNIDVFINEKQIPFIDILHADIQGFEVQMLQGAANTLFAKKVGYVFLSTHSNDLHDQCVAVLENAGYNILQSINLNASYSLDGLIVAASPNINPILNVQLSSKTKKRSINNSL